MALIYSFLLESLFQRGVGGADVNIVQPSCGLIFVDLLRMFLEASPKQEIAP